jgi:hypothetical protein
MFNAATLVSLNLQEKELQAKLKSLAAQKLENSEEYKGIAAQLASIAAQKAKIQGDKQETTGTFAKIAAKITETLVNWGLNASMAPMLAITLLLVAAMVALVAIIAAFIAIGNSLAGMYNKDAIAAEETANKAKALA